MGVVERTRRHVVLPEEPDRLDQFLVTVRDRGHLLAPAVAVLDDHRAPAVDLDVLHIRQIEQRLQPPVPEDGVLDRPHVRQLALAGPEVGTVTMERADMIADNAPDGRPPEQPPILSRQRPPRSTGLGLGLVGDRLRRSAPQFDHLRPVDEIVGEAILEVPHRRLAEHREPLGVDHRRRAGPAPGPLRRRRLQVCQDRNLAQPPGTFPDVVHAHPRTS